MTRAVDEGRISIAERETGPEAGARGFYLEFAIAPGEDEALRRLEHRGKQIELVAVREMAVAGGVPRLSATVFVPENHAEYYLGRVEEYRTEETLKGKPKHEALVARLDAARLASVRSIFTDARDRFPKPDVVVWWEVWLRVGRRGHFDAAARQFEIPTKEHVLLFPEREVVLALSSAVSLARVLRNSDAIAELRIAKDQPGVFLDMPAREQADWARDAVGRLLPLPPDPVAVCLLDSGVARDHPLIEPRLVQEDMHTCNPAWGTGDSGTHAGHGTGMGGLALYGDLVDVLAGNQPISVEHILESVKILPVGVPHEPDMYGWIMKEGVARAEIQAPQRERVVCLAVTSTDETATGRPTSWSAAVDQLAYGDGQQSRLLIISAGNVRDDLRPGEYLSINDVSGVESPAQAWNALTVGAYTEKVNVMDPDYQGILTMAPPGDLSPRSRTSVGWDRQWPIKPDIVLEGGNWGQNGEEAVHLEDLQLLTTRHDFVNLGLYRLFSDTSAATALGAKMAAELMIHQRRLWPETVRALIVHSAEWTSSMRDRLGRTPNQRQKANVLRRYGYGAPNLDRAKWSAANDLTIVIEDELQPYVFANGRVKTNEMKLYRFPWPRVVLEGLGDTELEMRVTLSYFVEPNPGERGWVRRHRYASHALRFEVKGMLETDEQFRGRINRAAWENDEREGGNLIEDDKWFLRQVRDTGSVHSDFWRATGAELAQRDTIGVYPVGGWWKEKPQLGRCDRSVRYALIVSIRAPEAEVDIYTPITAAIAAPVPIDV